MDAVEFSHEKNRMQKWIVIFILSFVVKPLAIAKNAITVMMLLFVKVVGTNPYNIYLNSENLRLFYERLL